MGYAIIAIFIIIVMIKSLPARGVNQITATDLKHELQDKNKQFIDVRTPGEFNGNNIKGFKNIPLQQLAQKADKELLKEKEVIVICQSGARSQRACKMLKKAGFSNVTNVKGGMSAWF